MAFYYYYYYYTGIAPNNFTTCNTNTSYNIYGEAIYLYNPKGPREAPMASSLGHMTLGGSSRTPIDGSWSADAAPSPAVIARSACYLASSMGHRGPGPWFTGVLGRM